MDCSHRDRGGRRWSLCLKHHIDGGAPRDCDLRNIEFCDHRIEDEDVRRLTDAFIHSVCCPCEHCGREHRNVREQLICQRLSSARKIIDGSDCDLPESTPRVNSAAWPRIRDMVLHRDSFTCTMCGQDLSSRPEWMREVHHMSPRRLGGTDDPRNLRTLCNACHQPLTEILMLKVEPRDEAGRMETELRRKFRNGRELLRSLTEDHAT